MRADHFGSRTTKATRAQDPGYEVFVREEQAPGVCFRCRAFLTAAQSGLLKSGHVRVRALWLTGTFTFIVGPPLLSVPREHKVWKRYVEDVQGYGQPEDQAS